MRTPPRIDPHWRRLEDGRAARLRADELLVNLRPKGRWRRVDPHRTDDGWRSWARLSGFLGWAGVVGVAWWLGASRERGPLAPVARLDEIGSTLAARVDGFDTLAEGSEADGEVSGPRSGR